MAWNDCVLFPQGDKDHPISPVLLTDEKLAAKFAEEMLGEKCLEINIA